jgi:glucosylceramidase
MLLPEYYPIWANYFVKYLSAFKAEGIDIWGLTVENEPHGNGNNWESMHFSPEEMTEFVKNHLGPTLEKSNWDHVNVLGYDQNRAGLKEWVDVMYANEENAKYYDGVAIHWYESTYDYFPEALDYAVNKDPNKLLIQTEACVDAEVPHWRDDDWYWSKEATDWGWDWASAEEKYLHPKYVPVYRYARDIIGCLNHGVQGWVDWNMVLDRQGGPNWFKNWCVAPVIVDPETDEVYFTPLYYTLAHFSKYIRPGAQRISMDKGDVGELQITAVKNVNGSIVVVVLNEGNKSKSLSIQLEEEEAHIEISAQALQTIILTKKPSKN